MPTIKYKNCTVEGDLAAAILEFKEYIGETSFELSQEIDQIETSQVELDAVNESLDRLLQYAPNPVSSTQIAQEVGLPFPDATSKDDEIRLEQHGLILINGVLWKKGSDRNIENYRRLYLALGSNITEFLKVVNQQNKNFCLVHRTMRVVKLPAGKWTLDLVRKTLNNYAIEELYKRGGDTYVVEPVYLGRDVSKNNVSLTSGIKPNKIFSELYWLGSIDNKTSTLTELRNLGVLDSFLSAAILGRDLAEMRPDLILSQKTTINQLRATCINQIEFLRGRLSLNNSAKKSLQGEILKTIESLKVASLELQQTSRFNPVVLGTGVDLAAFLLKNSTTDLEYLFKERRSVLSIEFTATTADLIARVRQILSIPPSNTTTSTLLLNNRDGVLSTTLDQANFESVKIRCAELKVQTIEYIPLQQAISCLQDDYIAPVFVPVQGYPTYDSPSSLLTRNVNWTVSLNTDAVTKALQALANLNAALNPLITGLLDAVNAANKATDKFFDDLNKKISTELRNVESFMSKYMSFVGTVTLESSLLKCALGFNFNADLGIELPFLADLIPLIEALRQKLKNFIAQILGLLTKFISKVSTQPAKLINQLLDDAEKSLPEFCKLNKVELPKEVNDKLLELKRLSEIQSETALSFNNNLARLRGSVDGITSKLESFRSKAGGQPSSNTNLASAFKKNLL